MKNKKNKNVPSNTETPNFVVFFVFKEVPSSFILKMSSKTEAKREAIFTDDLTEVNSTGYSMLDEPVREEKKCYLFARFILIPVTRQLFNNSITPVVSKFVF